MHYTIESYTPNKADRANPFAHPFYPDSLTNLSPAYIITCEFDPLKDTEKDFAEKLKNAKVPIIHKEMKSMVHSIPEPLNENDRLNLYKGILLESQK